MRADEIKDALERLDLSKEILKGLHEGTTIELEVFLRKQKREESERLLKLVDQLWTANKKICLGNPMREVIRREIELVCTKILCLATSAEERIAVYGKSPATSDVHKLALSQILGYVSFGLR